VKTRSSAVQSYTRYWAVAKSIYFCHYFLLRENLFITIFFSELLTLKDCSVTGNVLFIRSELFLLSHCIMHGLHPRKTLGVEELSEIPVIRLLIFLTSDTYSNFFFTHECMLR
jgi:hypothetical protein